MARVKDGFISGKVGEMVGYTRNGKNLLRRAPRRTAPPSEAELVNRHIFGLVQKWVNPIGEFLKQGFKDYDIEVAGANAAKSLIHKSALQRAGYESYVNPALVQVSYGNLMLPEILQAELAGTDVLFSWSTGEAGVNLRDWIMMLAYNIEKKYARYEITGARRMLGSDVLSLEGKPPGQYHLYAAFTSENMETRSNSKYLGVVEL